MRQFEVIGRRKAAEGDYETARKLYRMTIFAKNAVRARSRFWYFVNKLRRIKTAAGEIVSCSEVNM